MRRLDAINKDVAKADSELASLDAALETARQKIKATERDEQTAEARQRAVEAKENYQWLIENAPKLSEHAAALSDLLHEAKRRIDANAALGFGFPSAMQWISSITRATSALQAQWATKAQRGMPPRDGPNVPFHVVTEKPVFVGDGDVNPSQNAAASRSADGSHTAAYDQLMALAAEQRRRAPWMTPEAAFAAIYQDKANIEIVNRERFESRRRGTDRNPGWPS